MLYGFRLTAYGRRSMDCFGFFEGMDFMVIDSGSGEQSLGMDQYLFIRYEVAKVALTESQHADAASETKLRYAHSNVYLHCSRDNGISRLHT